MDTVQYAHLNQTEARFMNLGEGGEREEDYSKRTFAFKLIKDLPLHLGLFALQTGSSLDLHC